MLSNTNQKVIPVSNETELGQVASPNPNNSSGFIADDIRLEQGNDDNTSDNDDQKGDDANGLLNNVKSLRYRKRTWQDKFRTYASKLAYSELKQNTRWLMETASCTITVSFEDIILLITIYVLFAGDIRVLSATKNVDGYFSTSFAVAFFIFCAELILNTWSKSTFDFSWSNRPFPLKWEGYFASFFWWLDLISLLSLMPDIRFIAVPLGLGTLADAVSGNRSYTQAGRVVRLVRLVRLVRIYRVASEKRARQEQEEQLMELVRIGAIPYEEIENQRLLHSQRQSRLGKQLSDSTTRRVIIMILILLIIIPILIYSPNNEGLNFAARAFHSYNVANLPTVVKESAVRTLWDGLTQSNDNRYVDYLYLSPSLNTKNAQGQTGIDIPFVYYKSNLESLRDSVKVRYDYASQVGGVTYVTRVVYNLNEFARQIGLYSILTTIFVAIMMIGGAIIFSNDAERLVIKPIERMMNMVEAVAANPLAQFSFDHDGPNGGGAGQYETKLLESTVEKITGLLRVGFGEAGAGIISANLSNSGSNGGSASINPLLPGVRIYAIFGFCDIHHFEDINQKLANDVLIFVNTIADIVHNSVHTWSGQCNKNLGNAFVIVWRIGDENAIQQSIYGMGGPGAIGRTRSSFFENRMSSQKSSSELNASDNGSSHDDGSSVITKKKTNIDLKRVPGVDVLADHALIGYLKIIAEINRNRAVLKYRQEPRLTDNGKQEYKLRMGFGLHAGWAIEGAVGSIQKVDATYLSPHVNMAARLETSSRQYGVPLLASQDFYDLLSTDAQSACRRLDVVTVKGSEVPIGIYTYDCLQDQEFREDKKNRRPSFEKVSASSTGTSNHGMQSRKSFERPASSGALLSPAVATAATPDKTSSVPPPPIASPGPTNSQTPFQTPAVDPLANGSNHGSGTSSPVRRPSLTLVPGASKPAVFMGPDSLTPDIFENDYDLLTLRSHVTFDFNETFREGVSAYLAGDWNVAKDLLEKSDSMMLELAPSLGGDGPSKTLISYMKNLNYVPPSDWKGFRPLTSK